jgi:hypothetical protein
MKRMVRLILEAAQAELADQPRGAWIRSATVVQRALRADGTLTPQSKRWLADKVDERDRRAARFYDTLVRLVCGVDGQCLLEGQGNFGAVCYGYPDCPPAHPRYTECRITQRGLDFVEDTA